MKRAGRKWIITLNNTLIKMNFRRLVSEHCNYTKENNLKEILSVLVVYVDDILLAEKYHNGFFYIKNNTLKT